MKINYLIGFLLVISFFISCKNENNNTSKHALLEVEGKFLYREDVNEIIPPNVSSKDSTEIAENFIRNWVTNVLLYENAKRNITNKEEIDQLLEDYKKSLIIHQYQQKLLKERLPAEPSDAEILKFYDQYKEQLMLKENVVQGILLIIPANAPQKANVRNWIQSGNTKALENIEKYSMQHAITYDYFADKWLTFSEVLKRLPMQLEDQTEFLKGRKFIELSDSTKTYYLRINASKLVGQTEPYEMAKPKIINLIMNKIKSDFISNFENDIYSDAIKNEEITYFKN